MTSVPVTSAGIRSGVNWTRLNDSPRQSASDRTMSVLARPGTPTSKQCPPASTQVSNSSTTVCWPTMTRPSCEEISRAAAWTCSISEGAVMGELSVVSDQLSVWGTKGIHWVWAVLTHTRIGTPRSAMYCLVSVIVYSP